MIIKMNICIPLINKTTYYVIGLWFLLDNKRIFPVRVSAELLAVIGCTGTLNNSLHSGLSTLLDNLLQNQMS